MKRATLLFFTIIFSVGALWSQPVEMPLLGNWHDDDLVLTSWLGSRYNDVWGFVMNGQEYAAIGSTEAIHIIGLSDPTQPVEVARVYGEAIGPNLVHRDIKEFNGYLYCVADEGSTSTLQIIDLHPLPDSVSVLYNSNEFVVTSHNLFIDTAAQRLYAVGAQGKTKVMDISNPAQPVLLAAYPNSNYNLPYVHDAYVNNHIGYMNCGGQGLWVVDFSDPAAPVTLATLTDYPDQGYNHSGWVTEDEHYYFMCDENHGMDIKVLDISDPANLKVVAKFSPGLWNGEIAHNVVVRGNLLYASYYYNGVQVWDISNPEHPGYWGYYDTYPGMDETFYAGNWGIYPLLPSNTILASDMQGGLFVMAGLPQPESVHISPSSSSFELCKGESLELTLALGNGFGSPITLQAFFDGQPLSLNNLTGEPGDTLALSFDNLPPTNGSGALLEFMASDGSFQDTASVLVTIHDLPGELLLQSPAEGATEVNQKPFFEWQATTGATAYVLQLSTDPDDFQAGLVLEIQTTTDSLQLDTLLHGMTTYYWRVIALSGPCKKVSAVGQFTTALVQSVQDAAAAGLHYYPVPAAGRLFLSLENRPDAPVELLLYDALGRQCLKAEWPAGQTRLELDVRVLPMGNYTLLLRQGGNNVNARIQVLR